MRVCTTLSCLCRISLIKGQVSLFIWLHLISKKLLTIPPTEQSVLKHVLTVHEALETLIDVQKKGTSRVIHCSLVEVINFAVCLHFGHLLAIRPNLLATQCSRMSPSKSTRLSKSLLTETRTPSSQNLGASSSVSMHVLRISSIVLSIPVPIKVCSFFFSF